MDVGFRDVVLVALPAFVGSYLGQRVTRRTLAQLVRDAVHAELSGKAGVFERLWELEAKADRGRHLLRLLSQRLRALERSEARRAG